MKAIDEKTLLMEKIISLEYKQNYDLEVLKEELIAAYDTLNPIHIIKNTIHEVVTSPDVRQELLKKAVTVTMGYISKKLFFGINLNPAKRIIGSVLRLIKKRI
jgi:hypothetical protein